MARLEIDHLTVSYGKTPVVRDLSLTVDDGECIALLGPSGCGKSTTLRAISGFVRPSSGSIRIGGNDVLARPPHLRNVGLVFQDYALFAHLSVAENVAYGLKRRGVARSEIEPKVREALRMVRLDQHVDRYPNSMSGGQRQRVALARALVIRPDVLLLDEPLGALDRKLRDQMQYELKTLQAQLGFTCIIVTHDQEEALSLASRVALMLDGDIAEIGSPSQLYARPQSVRAMDFLGASSIIDAVVAESVSAQTYRLETGFMLLGPTTSLPRGARVRLGIRPELVRITKGRDLNVNGILATVRQIVFKGPSADVYLDGRLGNLRAQVEAGGTSDLSSLQPGEEVWASINPADILVFS
jgi:ABC-type Fe3+/spermidine/putrescine transport system ATPase subunit